MEYGICANCKRSAFCLGLPVAPALGAMMQGDCFCGLSCGWSFNLRMTENGNTHTGDIRKNDNQKSQWKQDLLVHNQTSFGTEAAEIQPERNVPDQHGVLEQVNTPGEQNEVVLGQLDLLVCDNRRQEQEHLLYGQYRQEGQATTASSRPAHVAERKKSIEKCYIDQESLDISQNPAQPTDKFTNKGHSSRNKNCDQPRLSEQRPSTSRSHMIQSQEHVAGNMRSCGHQASLCVQNSQRTVEKSGSSYVGTTKRSQRTEGEDTRLSNAVPAVMVFYRVIVLPPAKYFDEATGNLRVKCPACIFFSPQRSSYTLHFSSSACDAKGFHHGTRTASSGPSIPVRPTNATAKSRSPGSPGKTIGDAMKNPDYNDARRPGDSDGSHVIDSQYTSPSGKGSRNDKPIVQFIDHGEDIAKSTLFEVQSDQSDECNMDTVHGLCLCPVGECHTCMAPLSTPIATSDRRCGMEQEKYLTPAIVPQACEIFNKLAVSLLVENIDVLNGCFLMRSAGLATSDSAANVKASLKSPVQSQSTRREAQLDEKKKLAATDGNELLTARVKQSTHDVATKSELSSCQPFLDARCGTSVGRADDIENLGFPQKIDVNGEFNMQVLTRRVLDSEYYAASVADTWNFFRRAIDGDQHALERLHDFTYTMEEFQYVLRFVQAVREEEADPEPSVQFDDDDGHGSISFSETSEEADDGLDSSEIEEHVRFRAPEKREDNHFHQGEKTQDFRTLTQGKLGYSGMIPSILEYAEASKTEITGVRQLGQKGPGIRKKSGRQCMKSYSHALFEGFAFD